MNKINLTSLHILVLQYQTMLKPLKGEAFEEEAKVQIDLAEIIAGLTHNGPEDWALLGEFTALTIMLGTAYADSFEDLFHEIYPGISLRTLEGMRQLRDFCLDLNGDPDYVIIESNDASRICRRASAQGDRVTPYEIYKLISERLDLGFTPMPVNTVDAG